MKKPFFSVGRTILGLMKKNPGRRVGAFWGIMAAFFLLPAASLLANTELEILDVGNNNTFYVGDEGNVVCLYNFSVVTPATLKSSNTKVLAVSGKNWVIAKGKGTATLTATYKGITATQKITVKYPLAISGAATIQAEKSTTYKATMQGNSISDPNHTKLSWKVSNTKLASIDKNGKLSAKAAGEISVTATFKSKAGTFTTSKTVKITKATPSVKSLTISGAAKLIRGAKASAYTVTAVYTDGKKKTVTPTWKVSNTKLATMSKDGKLSPIGVGTVKITATFGGKSVTKSITIEAEHMKSVSISGAATVTVGKSSKYKLIGKLTNGQSAGETPNAAWKSSNTKIATIDKNGKLVAKAAGKVTITGTYKSKDTHTAQKTITIKK